MSFDSQFIFIFFLGRTDRDGEGFKLSITDAGTTTSSKRITFRREESSFNLRYPIDGSSSYNNHEAFFILGTPALGMAVDVTVSNIRTEPTHDVVTLLWVNPDFPNATSCVR